MKINKNILLLSVIVSLSSLYAMESEERPAGIISWEEAQERASKMVHVVELNPTATETASASASDSTHSSQSNLQSHGSIEEQDVLPQRLRTMLDEAKARMPWLIKLDNKINYQTRLAIEITGLFLAVAALNLWYVNNNNTVINFSPFAHQIGSYLPLLETALAFIVTTLGTDFHRFFRRNAFKFGAATVAAGAGVGFLQLSETTIPLDGLAVNNDTTSPFYGDYVKGPDRLGLLHPFIVDTAIQKVLFLVTLLFLGEITHAWVESAPDHVAFLEQHQPHATTHTPEQQVVTAEEVRSKTAQFLDKLKIRIPALAALNKRIPYVARLSIEMSALMSLIIAGSLWSTNNDNAANPSAFATEIKSYIPILETVVAFLVADFGTRYHKFFTRPLTRATLAAIYTGIGIGFYQLALTKINPDGLPVDNLGQYPQPDSLGLNAPFVVNTGIDATLFVTAIILIGQIFGDWARTTPDYDRYVDHSGDHSLFGGAVMEEGMARAGRIGH